MQTQDSAAPPRSGLLTALDIVIAPKAAFTTLREAPTWGWAFLISAVVGIAAAFLLLPTYSHALDVSLPAQLAANPSIAKMPADQQQQAIATGISYAKIGLKFAWIALPFIILLSAL